MENKIKYQIGDATNPICQGNKIIVHICNDIGAWGKGFVLAVSKRWIEPEQEYKKWFKSEIDFGLGKVQFVKVSNDLIVANLIGQRDIRYKDSTSPIRYDAVKRGLDIISKKAIEINATIHMPRIGCGLAGGEWNIIEGLIDLELIKKGIEVNVYDLK